MDLVAKQLRLDAGKPFDALGWARARIEALRALQSRPGHDGNIYQPGDWVAEVPRDRRSDFPEQCSGLDAVVAYAAQPHVGP